MNVYGTQYEPNDDHAWREGHDTEVAGHATCNALDYYCKYSKKQTVISHKSNRSGKCFVVRCYLRFPMALSTMLMIKTM